MSAARIVLTLALQLWRLTYGYALRGERGDAKAFTTVARPIPQQVLVTVPSQLDEALVQEVREGLENKTGFDVRIFSDDEMTQSTYTISKQLDEVGIPGAYDAFEMLRPGSYRADLWRYMMLWSEGGIYIDEGVRLTAPPSWIDFKSDSLVVVKDATSGSYWNGMMAASPRHPLLEKAIQVVVKQVNQRMYGMDPLDVTGPRVLYKVLHSDPRSGLDNPAGLHTWKAKLRLGIDPPQAACGDYPHPPCNVTIYNSADEIVAAEVAGTHAPHGPSHYSNLWHEHQVYCDEPCEIPSFCDRPRNLTAEPRAP